MGAIYLMEGPLLRVLWEDTTRMIRVDWTEATAAMTDDEFKRALGWIADHVAERPRAS